MLKTSFESFICGHNQNRFICGAHAENKFGEFHLRAQNEFGYFVEQWLKNEEIPVVLWSNINLT
jgi:hypothetical protein